MTGSALARTAAWVPPLAALWWIVTEGRGGSWGVGAPVVLLAALTAAAVLPAPRRWIRPAALPRFLLFFGAQSIRGGVDVARRVLSPSMRLAPGFLTHRTFLPEGAPRVLLADVVSLLPGTVTVDLDGDHLRVHALEAGSAVHQELRAVEDRVAALFGLARPGAEGRP